MGSLVWSAMMSILCLFVPRCAGHSGSRRPHVPVLPVASDELPERRHGTHTSKLTACQRFMSLHHCKGFQLSIVRANVNGEGKEWKES